MNNYSIFESRPLKYQDLFSLKTNIDASKFGSQIPPQTTQIQEEKLLGNTSQTIQRLVCNPRKQKIEYPFGIESKSPINTNPSNNTSDEIEIIETEILKKPAKADIEKSDLNFSKLQKAKSPTISRIKMNESISSMLTKQHIKQKLISKQAPIPKLKSQIKEPVSLSRKRNLQIVSQGNIIKKCNFGISDPEPFFRIEYLRKGERIAQHLEVKQFLFRGHKRFLGEMHLLVVSVNGEREEAWGWWTYEKCNQFAPKQLMDYMSGNMLFSFD